MKAEIEAKRVAAELVKASVEGRLKRKRTYEFEKEKMVRDGVRKGENDEGEELSEAEFHKRKMWAKPPI